MPAFEYKQAEEIKEALKRHQVRYLFIGKSGAILLGFPDTTQDADLFVDRSVDNGRALVAALRELGFDLSDNQASEIERGKVFVQSATARSILILFSRRMGSNGLKMPGIVMSMSKTSPFAILMTL